MKHYKTKHGVLYHGDCIEVMKFLSKTKCKVDLVFGSPPYEDVRDYDELKGQQLAGQGWADWMRTIVEASVSVTEGLVAYVVGHGKTRDYKWSAAPALLQADLHRAGYCLRNPVCYKRIGTGGSGQQDWLRADHETIICITRNQGKLPWSDNTACGPPNPQFIGQKVVGHENGVPVYLKAVTRRHKDGSLVKTEETRKFKARNNPGNVIDCGTVGFNRDHSNISKENDACFPRKLPDFFIRSFCPPDGVVFDPFVGSGTTVEMAILNGRRFVACDLRESQIQLTLRRIKQAEKKKGLGL